MRRVSKRQYVQYFDKSVDLKNPAAHTYPHIHIPCPNKALQRPVAEAHW